MFHSDSTGRMLTFPFTNECFQAIDLKHWTSIYIYKLKNLTDTLRADYGSLYSFVLLPCLIRLPVLRPPVGIESSKPPVPVSAIP